MPDAASTALVHALGRHQLLEKAQLEAITPLLEGGAAGPQALGEELVRRRWLTAFQVQQVLRGRAADLVLGPYVILQPLGDGASGQVFQARHQKMDRLVAVKVLHKGTSSDREAVQRFYREIEAASRLDHPNIIYAYEAGPIGNTLALVMEYVDGLDLERTVQRNGPLPVLQACAYVRQAALGLAYAHEHGLVHRDIKPSNLMVTQAPGAADGLVKILDFGLARLRYQPCGSRTADLTTDGKASVTQGTPDYMSPEQALDFHGADIRSDLYSLGCTFYFLLAGRPPFAGSSLAAKLLSHQQQAPPPLPRRDLPPGLLPILNRLLAKDPATRYQTPGELAEALAVLMRSGSLRPGRRRLPRLLLPVAACVALVLFGFFLTTSSSPPSHNSTSHNGTRAAATTKPVPPPPPPGSLEAVAPEARDYQLVYDLNLARLARTIVYDEDRHAKLTQRFDRVAYFIELRRNEGAAQYLYVSMAAFTTDLKKIGVPTIASGASFQTNVASMNVYSNVTGIVTGTGLPGGNIEFWPNNYGPANAANVPNADASKFDFGDQMTGTGPQEGYGSMQVHNHEAKQTLFAVNHWGASGGADIGIGNNPSGNPDWTFAGNAGSYRAKRLRVLVRCK